jgi:hypothetical protein
VRRIHDDGAMTAPSLSMHDEFVVAKIHPISLLTRPDPRAPTDVMRRKGLEVGLCYDGNTNPRRRNHAVTRGQFTLFASQVRCSAGSPFVRHGAAACGSETEARYCGDRTAISAAASQPPHSEAAIAGRAV